MASGSALALPGEGEAEKRAAEYARDSRARRLIAGASAGEQHRGHERGTFHDEFRFKNGLEKCAKPSIIIGAVGVLSGKVLLRYQVR